jgi:hypothetical protein
MVNKGAYARFTWRAIYLVTHTDGGILPRIIRAWTGDNDKSPYVASTMADRVMLLRLMRMGGSKEDDDNNPQEAQQQQARPAQRQQRTPAPRAAPQISPEQMKAAQDMLTELLENLKLCKTSDAFVTWARIYQHDYGLPQNIQKQGWTEWGKAVQALNYAPAELAEQARRAGKVNDGPADGEVTSDSEPPLAPAGTPASSPPKEPSEQAR